MKVKEHFRKNIILAYPVMIGQLGHIMVNVADSMMVGRVGHISLAAATFAGAIYTLLVLFGIGMSYAITPLVAAENPENKSVLLRYFQNGLLINICSGTILTGIGIGISYFLDYFGQEHEVATMSKSYLQWMSASILLVTLFQTFRQYAEGLSDTLTPMMVSIIANLLNVFLNWVFIFGNLGFEPMGLFGAGLATFTSRIPMVLLILILMWKKIKDFKWKFDWIGIHKMLKIGLPSGVQYIFEVGAFGGTGIMIGWIGSQEQAAHNIALNLIAVTYMACTGIATAATIRIGNQFGMKNKVNLRMAGFTCFWLAGTFMAFWGIIFIISRNFLPTLYIENKEVILIASDLLIIGAAFQIFDGLQAVGLGVLRGLKDVNYPTCITFIAYWVLALPLGYILAFPVRLGVNGFWISLSIGLTFAATFHVFRFNKLSAKLNFDSF